MKVIISLGIPTYLIKTEFKDEYTKTVLNEYLDKFAIIGATKKDIDVEIIPTEGDEFFTKVSYTDVEDGTISYPESSKTVYAKEPVDLKKVLDVDNHEKSEEEDNYVNFDITEEQEKVCSKDDNIKAVDKFKDIVDAPIDVNIKQLSKLEKNIALLKLYLMLKDGCGMQELHTKYGSTYIDWDEKAFLLHKLFELTGLDAIAKEVEKTLDK